MDYSDAKQLMKQYLVARIPFISFKTIEKSRGIALLKDIAVECNIDISVYSMSKGLINIKDNSLISEEKSLIGILDFIGNQVKVKENATFVITDFPDIYDENINTRYLCDIVSIAEEKNCSIIVINDNNVYQRLQRMGMTIEMDLPNEQELYYIIKNFINAYKNSVSIEWNEDDVVEFISSHLENEKGGYKKDDIKNISFQKRR